MERILKEGENYIHCFMYLKKPYDNVKHDNGSVHKRQIYITLLLEHYGKYTRVYIKILKEEYENGAVNCTINHYKISTHG